MFSNFLHNNRYYAFLEVPVSLLDEEIDGSSLLDTIFIPTYSLNNSKVIIRLTKRDGDYYINTPQLEDSLNDWNTWLTDKGYSVSNWLTLTERNALLQNKKYNNE